MKCKRCGHEMNPIQIAGGWSTCVPCLSLIEHEWLIRKQEIDLDLHNDNSGKAF